MKSIAFHLQKGGTGKTTLSGSIAHELKQRGKTILLDLDPQGNATSWHLTGSMAYELADVLQGKVSAGDAIQEADGLFILPTFGLDGGLKVYGETRLNDEPFIFMDLLEDLKALGFEYVVMDLSPGMGRLEKSALLACDEVITPMTPEYFGLDGIEIFTNELERIRKNMKRAPAHKKVVVNAFDSRIGQHVEIQTRAQGLKFQVFTVPVDPVFRKAQAVHKSPQTFGGMKAETRAAIEAIGGALWQ